MVGCASRTPRPRSRRRDSDLHPTHGPPAGPAPLTDRASSIAIATCHPSPATPGEVVTPTGVVREVGQPASQVSRANCHDMTSYAVTDDGSYDTLHFHQVFKQVRCQQTGTTKSTTTCKIGLGARKTRKKKSVTGRELILALAQHWY